MPLLLSSQAKEVEDNNQFTKPGALCLQEKSRADENKAVIRRLVEKGMNRDQLHIFEESYSLAYIQRRGVEGFKEQSRQTRSAFPDYAYTIEYMIAEGDRVAVRWSMKGTHLGEYRGIATTGRNITLTGMHIFRLESGKIEEMWSEASRENLLKQIS